MAAIGRDAAVEAAIAAVEGVVQVEAAIAVAGLPGVRAARVRVLLEDDGSGLRAADASGPDRAARADPSGAVALAVLAALRAAHGAAITGSIAIERLVDGVRATVPPREPIAAAGLTGAVAAGGELLFSMRTRVEAGA
ncbi:hypothetical protein [Agrococcus sp. ARC_14]|uniref:hypothetical protein n=1 Tax=Agrococcus sp. ARC_14 TaxID=2919927 RepID=UPI001F06A02E|nr:hypothetical protein [Agrococcus sp. ARC_14]MCH1884143.1 hypothetical protein [Agrococcus sp. ARC_14]